MLDSQGSLLQLCIATLLDTEKQVGCCFKKYESGSLVLLQRRHTGNGLKELYVLKVLRSLSIKMSCFSACMPPVMDMAVVEVAANPFWSSMETEHRYSRPSIQFEHFFVEQWAKAKQWWSSTWFSAVGSQKSARVISILPQHLELHLTVMKECYRHFFTTFSSYSNTNIQVRTPKAMQMLYSTCSLLKTSA